MAKLTLFAVSHGLAGLGLLVCANAGAAWIATDIGSYAGQTLRPLAVSGTGYVVGHTTSYLQGAAQGGSAFVHYNGVTTQIGAAGQRGTANVVNNAGQVGGSLQSDRPIILCCNFVEDAFLYSAGTTLLFQSPAGPNNSATVGGINAAGQMVGYEGPQLGLRAVTFFPNGASAALNSPPLGRITPFSFAVAVNDSGTILWQNRVEDVSFTDNRAYIYQGGVNTALGPVGAYMQARDINNAGQILVQGVSESAPYGWAILANGTTTFIDESGAYGSFNTPRFLNESGQVAGDAQAPTAGLLSGVYVYSAGAMTFLPRFFAIGGDSAWGFNDAGQVLLRGQIVRPTPIPDPIFGTVDFDYAVYDDGTLIDLEALVAGLGIVDVIEAVMGNGHIAGTGSRADHSVVSFLLTSTAASVPEPGVMGLVFVALAGGLLQRNRRQRITAQTY
jgi:hypothetical protein